MDKNYDIRPDVVNYDDVCKMIPQLKGHRKLVENVLHFLWIDRVNAVHGRYYKTPGVEFSHHLAEQEFKVNLRIDNEQVLKDFSDGAFITVSNHPFGALDGILLLHLVGKHRPDFKVMVNMFLNYLSAMRESFIAVDPSKSDNPEKKKTTMQGIREVMQRVREGHPVGFFPAGAVSKINKELRIRDREWQPSVVRLIQQLKVPVVPIYFHGHNSTFFNILGLIDWRLRTLRLPREVFLKTGKEIHVSIGNPISPEEIARYSTVEELGKFLKQSTYDLEKIK
jgi:putative hemolysin